MKIGIEHEYVFKDRLNNFLDLTNSSYNDFQKVVERFPIYEEDKGILECKSLESVPKRCYVEGFERYDKNGRLFETIPKGLEIRTPPFEDINEIIENFVTSNNIMTDIASSFGLTPLLVSFNPYTNFQKVYELLEHENRNGRNDFDFLIAQNSMLLHAFHINVSVNDESKLGDIAEKLNFYLPYIIPFSFSSPFHSGEIFNGLSARMFELVKYRPLVSIRKRVNASVVEFRGFDVVGDSQLLKALLSLIKFLANDNALMGRNKEKDVELIELSSLEGFENEKIKNGANAILDAAKNSDVIESDQLELLYSMVESNESYSAKMKREFSKTNNIIKSMSNMYNFTNENVFEKSA